MSIANNTSETGNQRDLYSQRAADFHSLVTGSLHGENSVEHYLRLVRTHGEGGAIIDVDCCTGEVINDLSTNLFTTRLVGAYVVDEMLAIGRNEAAACRGMR